VVQALIPPTKIAGIKTTAYAKSDVVSEAIAYLISTGSFTPPLPAVGSSPILDWNPASGATISNGNVISLADKSGHGNTGAPIPNALGRINAAYTAKDAAFNNRPSISISRGFGANTFSGYASGGFTVFMAWVDLATVGADPGGFLYCGRGIPTGHLTQQDWDQLSTATAAGNTDALVEDSATSSFNIASDWGLTGAGALYVHQDAGTNATHIVRLNGTTKARGSTLSASDPGAGPAGAQSWAIGAEPGTGASARNGRFARVLIYPSALSLGDITTLESYFTSTYGV